MKRTTLLMMGLLLVVYVVVSAETNPASAQLSNNIFTVDTTSDEIDNNVGDKKCITASRTCSLQAAIMEANASTGSYVIRFDAPLTIPINDHLPEITEDITIDGVTGNSSTCPTTTAPANLGVTLESNFVDANGDNHALHISGGTNRSIIKGLRIVGFSGNGIHIDDPGSQVVVTCNEIGFDFSINLAL